MKNFKQKPHKTSYFLATPTWIKNHKPVLNQQVILNPYILSSITSLNTAHSLATWEVMVCEKN